MNEELDVMDVLAKLDAPQSTPNGEIEGVLEERSDFLQRCWRSRRLAQLQVHSTRSDAREARSQDSSTSSRLWRTKTNCVRHAIV